MQTSTLKQSIHMGGISPDPYGVFSLTWSASMQIYWNKRKRLHKKRVQLSQDWFGTSTWPPFHCFDTPILVFQNNETAAMLVYQENPLGV